MKKSITLLLVPAMFLTGCVEDPIPTNKSSDKQSEQSTDLSSGSFLSGAAMGALIGSSLNSNNTPSSSSVIGGSTATTQSRTTRGGFGGARSSAGSSMG